MGAQDDYHMNTCTHDAIFRHSIQAPASSACLLLMVKSDPTQNMEQCSVMAFIDFTTFWDLLTICGHIYLMSKVNIPLWVSCHNCCVFASLY